MAIEIVDFPINSMVIFHCKLLVHQRVEVLQYVVVNYVLPTIVSVSNYGLLANWIFLVNSNNSNFTMVFSRFITPWYSGYVVYNCTTKLVCKPTIVSQMGYVVPQILSQVGANNSNFTMVFLR